MKRVSTNTITQLAMMLGVLLVIEMIESMFFRMPQGGSISISSVMFILFASFISFRESAFLFILWRTMSLLIVPPYIVSPLQFFIEYYGAYSGFLLVYPMIKGRKVISMMAGSAVANVLRYVAHSLAGVIFFADFATGPVWQYSFGYNLTYMLPTALLHLAIIFIVVPILKKIKHK